MGVLCTRGDAAPEYLLKSFAAVCEIELYM